MSSFQSGEGQWLARMGTLRQVVRQEMVSRQLATHLSGLTPRRVLDVGCGQGTQLLGLARQGHLVTGVDSSATMLADLTTSLAAEPPAVQERVTVQSGDVGRLSDLFAPSSFDVVLCHGVLMYFADPEPVVTSIAHLLAPGGLVSVLARNGDGLAMRSGLMGDWAATRKAFDGNAYLNRIGVQARADSRITLTALLAEQGLGLVDWYGVRVFTDAADADAPLPDPEELELLLTCEELAGRTDPYRSVAALIHLIAERP